MKKVNQISFLDFVKNYFPESSNLKFPDHYKKIMEELTSEEFKREYLCAPSRLHEADKPGITSLKGIEMSHIIMDDLSIESTEEDREKALSFIEKKLPLKTKGVFTGNNPIRIHEDDLPTTKKQFKAFIRVVKSLTEDHGYYGSENVIRESLILADDKAEVKSILIEKYPQFFPTSKVYERESKKDKAQFFYVVIFPLYNYESELIKEGSWTCSSCGQVHENKYISAPRKDERLFGDDVFLCRSEEDTCYKKYVSEKYKTSNNGEIPDDLHYIKSYSPNYIYKITEKSSGKSYIGKTRNAPFFRWWNHLTHSSSPFGLYLRESKLSDWTFEVLEELPFILEDSNVLRIESEYIIKYDCINNGFNTVISNKSVVKKDDNELKLNFEE